MDQAEIKLIIDKYITQENFPGECLNTDYYAILLDCHALQIKTKQELENILKTHLTDSYFACYDERKNYQIKVQKIKPTHEVNNPTSMHVIRKCFELRFGIKWLIYMHTKIAPQKSIPIKKFELQPIDKTSFLIPDNKLYKYITYQTAICIFSNLTLRSSSLLYSDIYDLKVAPTLPRNKNKILKTIQDVRNKVYFSNEPCKGENGDIGFKLMCMASAIRTPTTAKEKLNARRLESDLNTIECIKHGRKNMRTAWKHSSRYFRVICLSIDPNGKKLWEEHGENHQGIRICFQPQVGSFLTLAKPVTYSNKFKPICSIIEWAKHLQGEQCINWINRYSKFACIKKTHYRWEQEWRCVFLCNDWEWAAQEELEPEKLFHDLFIDPKDIYSVKLGSNMSENNKNILTNLIARKAPHVIITT